MRLSLRSDPHTGSSYHDFGAIQIEFGCIRLHRCKNRSLAVKDTELASRYWDVTS